MKFLHRFWPEYLPVNKTERTRASIGAFVGILLAAVATNYFVLSDEAFPFLIAPIGASAVLLFAIPSSPLAQPWSILGGNVISAFVGVSSYLLVNNLMLACALAVGVSILLMFALRCLHPPGGAVALTAVIGGSAIHNLGFQFIWMPVAVNSLILLITALLYNNLTKRPYPHSKLVYKGAIGTNDLKPGERFAFKPEDLDYVLKQYNQVMDVSRDDLEGILRQTEMHAYRRKFREFTCEDIMSKDVITVEFGTPLEEAWALLRNHNIKALPVLDKAKRVIGIVTQIDFMDKANLNVYPDIKTKLIEFIKATTTSHSSKAEVVGQIMSSPAVTSFQEMHVIGLVPLMSQNGVHHIPIVDKERRLSGIVTQSDLVTVLFA